VDHRDEPGDDDCEVRLRRPDSGRTKTNRDV